MKIALLSDIHGNLEALEKALESVEKSSAEKIFCLGDLVGYGASPAECVTLIRERAEFVLLGNHDAAVVGRDNLAYFNDFARSAIVWTRSFLGIEHKEYLRGLPLEIHDDDLHLVHATPRHPELWNYIFSDYDVQDQFEAVKGRICFVGHSHVPGVYHEHQKTANPPEASVLLARRIVNVGSVGQSRDRDPKLCYVIYDTESQQIQFVREEYDVETAAGKIRRAGLPEFLADRLFWGW